MPKPASLALAAAGALALLGPLALTAAAQSGDAGSEEANIPHYLKLDRTIATRVDARHLPVKDYAIKSFFAAYVAAPVSPGCYPVVHLEGYRADGWAAGNVNFVVRGTGESCRSGHWQIFHKEGFQWGESLRTNGTLACSQVQEAGVPRDVLATCHTDEGQIVPNPVR